LDNAQHPKRRHAAALQNAKRRHAAALQIPSGVVPPHSKLNPLALSHVEFLQN
jgi:hypothetical protein